MPEPPRPTSSRSSPKWGPAEWTLIRAVVEQTPVSPASRLAPQPRAQISQLAEDLPQRLFTLDQLALSELHVAGLKLVLFFFGQRNGLAETSPIAPRRHQDVLAAATDRHTNSRRDVAMADLLIWGT